MVKPVNVNEMVLRVGALLRRAQILNAVSYTHLVALVGHREIAVQARAHAAIAVRRLVDIDDLGLVGVALSLIHISAFFS